MPNIKSAKKRVLVNDKKTEQNKAIRSAVRTEIKKLELLIKENKLDEAQAALPGAFAIIDSASSKNIIHANNAANKKAKLAKKIAVALSNAAPSLSEQPAVESESAIAEQPAAENESSPAEQPADAQEAPVKKPRKPRAKKTETETAE